jgi:hypothetical protein
VKLRQHPVKASLELKIFELTSIQRWIDPRYPTNLAISGLSLTVGALAFIYQLLTGASLLDGFSYAFSVTATVFLGWALARELDPDRDYSAFLAAGLGLLGYFLYGSPGLLDLLLVLVAVRIINRTVGPPATLFDSLFLLSLGIFLTFQNGLLPGLLAAGAFILDGLLPVPNRRNLLFALLIAASVIIYGVVVGFSVDLTAFKPDGYLILGLASVLYLPVIYSYRMIGSVCDRSGEPLVPVRVQAGMAFGLIAGWFAWLLGAWQILFPLWMAIAAVAVYYLVSLFLDWVQGALSN